MNVESLNEAENSYEVITRPRSWGVINDKFFNLVALRLDVAPTCVHKNLFMQNIKVKWSPRNLSKYIAYKD